MSRPMDPDRYQKIKTIFFAAAEKAGAEREAYLDTECGADAGGGGAEVRTTSTEVALIVTRIR